MLPPSASRLVPRRADTELRDEVIETLIGNVVVTLRGEIRPTLPGSITQRSDFGRILRFLAFQETETFPAAPCWRSGSARTRPATRRAHAGVDSGQHSVSPLRPPPWQFMPSADSGQEDGSVTRPCHRPGWVSSFSSMMGADAPYPDPPPPDPPSTDRTVARSNLTGSSSCSKVHDHGSRSGRHRLELRRVTEPQTLHVLVADLDNALGSQRCKGQVLAHRPAAALGSARRPGRKVRLRPCPRMVVERRNQLLQVGEQFAAPGGGEGADHPDRHQRPIAVVQAQEQ